MVRYLYLILLSALTLVFVGCASDQPADPNRVSTIPFNRPEKWESQGGLGGFMPGSN